MINKIKYLLTTSMLFSIVSAHDKCVCKHNPCKASIDFRDTYFYIFQQVGEVNLYGSQVFVESDYLNVGESSGLRLQGVAEVYAGRSYDLFVNGSDEPLTLVPIKPVNITTTATDNENYLSSSIGLTVKNKTGMNILSETFYVVFGKEFGVPHLKKKKPSKKHYQKYHRRLFTGLVFGYTFDRYKTLSRPLIKSFSSKFEYEISTANAWDRTVVKEFLLGINVSGRASKKSISVITTGSIFMQIRPRSTIYGYGNVQVDSTRTAMSSYSINRINSIELIRLMKFNMSLELKIIKNIKKHFSIGVVTFIKLNDRAYSFNKSKLAIVKLENPISATTATGDTKMSYKSVYPTYSVVNVIENNMLVGLGISFIYAN